MKKYIFLLSLLFLLIKIHAQTPTWSLVWSDEFTATAIDPTNWNFETGGGGWGNNELENYTSRPDNAIIENGYLNIIAKKENYGGSNYTSARMTTKTKRNLTYGRVEARIKIPAEKGIWPAFWMLGENISSVGWPQCGEIDILEHVNKDADIHGTIHWDNNGHAQYGGKTPCTVTDYHVYSIEWDSTTIKWFLDGTEYFNANIANNINSTNEFHNSFFVILNVAVGGTWPGNPDGTTVFPDTMSVDYVRFYQLRAIPPTPVITASGSLTLCQGDSVTLTCSSANSYLWSNTETTQSIVVKTSGTYTVSIDGGVAVSDSIVVVINALPPTPTITETGGGGAQGSSSSVLNSSATSGNQWYLEGNLISGADQQTYSPTPGNHTVLVTDINGCKALSSNFYWLPVPTSPSPTPVITFNPSLTICQGDSVTLTCSSATSYLWSNSETTQSIVVKTAGTYTVSIDGGAAVSNSITVTVNTVPTVGIAVDPSAATVCEGGSVTLTGTGATTYVWTGGVTNGISFSPSSTGVTTFTVTGTSNACSGTSSQSITVNNCIGGTGVIEVSTGIQDINIYPNPNNGLFKIETKNNVFSRIKIVNVLGEIMYDSTDQKLEFDLSSQSKGTYFVDIYTQDKTVHTKLMIQ